MSICVTADGFSVSIYNNIIGGRPLQHDVVRLHEGNVAHELLEQALTRPRLTDYSFTQVELVADTPATWLPLEDFRSSDVHALYKLNFPRSETKNSEEHYEIVPSLEAVVLFSLDEQIRETVVSLYPEAQLRSRQSLLLEDALEHVRHTRGNARQCHAYVEEDSLLLCIFQQKKLLFVCSYEARYDADRLYYLLSAWKSLQMDTTKDHCHLHGASDTLQVDVERFIKNTESED